MKKYKGLKITLLVLLVVIAIVLAGGWTMFGTQIQAANTVNKLDDDFYTMTYTGEYGFADFLEQGGAASDEELAAYIASFLSHGFYQPDMQKGAYGCSTLSVTSPDGDALFGRNFDWQDCTAMVVVARPEGGYNSISTSNLDFLGFGDDWLPEGMQNKIMSLAAVYVPLDGMNETGLCVADLIIDDGTETHQDTDKPDITTTSAIRLLLDKAATVEEAIALLEQYDMNSSAGMQHHLSIADAGGKSVVVEYIDEKMYVTESPAVTNFYLTSGDHYGIGSEQSQQRYQKLCVLLDDCGGVMSKQEVMCALEAVTQKNYNAEYDTTQWSAVFHPKTGTATYWRKENFDKNYVFQLFET